MVDPYLDPLDAAPVNRANPVFAPRFDGLHQPEEESFGDVLSRTFEAEATPIMTPDALRVPHLSNSVYTTIPTPTSEDVPPEPQATPPPVAAGSGSLPVSLNSENVAGSNDPAAKPMSLQPSGEDMARILNLRVENTKPNLSSKSISLDKSSQTPKPLNDSLPDNELTPSEIKNTQYTIQRGDTLSTIVLSAMRNSGMEFNTRDVYQMVQVVAAQNRMINPNRIYPGRVIDLNAIYSGEVVSEKNPKKTAMAEDIQSPIIGEVTSLFGNRIHPILNEERFHNGVDISAVPGTPVLPIKAGTVTFSGEKNGYGQVVEVDHGDGTQSIYAHLSERLASVGDRIQTIDCLGLSGDSGRSTGPHLHLEIHQHGVPVDPLALLPRDQIENPTQLARGN